MKVVLSLLGIANAIPPLPDQQASGRRRFQCDATGKHDYQLLPSCMMAAVGNHVSQLHRTEIGAYQMPADLAEGEWRWLYPEDLKQLSQSVVN